jgi:ribosomal protein S18 acetylase RimI-like enzyme
VSRPSTEVRRAAASDLDELTGLWGRARDEAGGSARALAGGPLELLRGRLADALGTPGVTIMVASHDGDLAGYAVFRRGPLMPVVDGPTLHVESVYVDSPYRRRGIARLLLGAAVAAAERDGIEQIVVNVLPGSREANRMLARVGFTPLVVRRVATTATVRRGLSGTARRSGLEELLSRRRTLRARTVVTDLTDDGCGEATPREGIAARLRIEARRARRIDVTDPAAELVKVTAEKASEADTGVRSPGGDPAGCS